MKTFKTFSEKSFLLRHSPKQTIRRRVQLTFLVSRVTGEGGVMWRRQRRTSYSLQAQEQAKAPPGAAPSLPAYYSSSSAALKLIII